MIQIELGQLQADELAARQQLDALALQVSGAVTHVADYQEGGRGRDVRVIEQSLLYLGALDERLADQRCVIADLEGRIAAKREELLAAVKDRKVMEKLKERHDRAYADWAAKMESRAIDDVVIARYHRDARDASLLI